MSVTARRIMSLIITVFMIAGMVLILPACDIVDIVKDKVIDPYQEPVSKQELARLIIGAISRKSDVSDSYSQIPDKQLDGISYSVFNEYVSILRDLSADYGEVESFRFLDDEDKNSYIDKLLRSSGREKVPEAYGDIDVVALVYKENQDKREFDSSCKFLISEDANGTAYLCKEMVVETIAAHNYLEHYFTMLENNNTDGLFALLSPLYDANIYINTVITAKAKYISEYYMLKVRSTRGEYIYDEVTPFLVHVTIPKVLDDDGESLTSHEVTLYVHDNGNYAIEDKIPWYLDSTGIGVYDSSGNPQRIQGVTLNENKLEALFGKPMFTRVTAMSAQEKAATGKTFDIRAFYNGIIITIYGDQDASGKWFGEVGGMRIYNDSYSIDGHIAPGMNQTELLLIYPMLDEEDYTFTFASGKDSFRVNFEFDDNNNISNIKIAKEKK
ncbi:MAG: hypothetical protein IKH76_03200 [Clostridiales bacterium]|nr:hypothetical protein [Clostridiales bacterium]